MRLVLIAGIGLAGLAAAGSLADARGGDETVRASAVTGGDLFVSTADGGTLRRLPGHKRTYRLTLKMLGAPVTVFDDRPQRRTRTESTAAFVRRWRSRGFDRTPPNAALVLATGKRRTVAVLEISRPRLRKGTLSFTARSLARKTSRPLPRRFSRASLFIDPSDSEPQTLGITYTYNGTTSDDASVGIDGQGLQLVNVNTTGGSSQVRAAAGQPAFLVLSCRKSGTAPCAVSADVLLTPARSPVSVLADPGSNGKLTARLYPDGAEVPLDSGRHSLTGGD